MQQGPYTFLRSNSVQHQASPDYYMTGTPRVPCKRSMQIYLVKLFPLQKHVGSVGWKLGSRRHKNEGSPKVGQPQNPKHNLRCVHLFCHPLSLYVCSTYVLIIMSASTFPRSPFPYLVLAESYPGQQNGTIRVKTNPLGSAATAQHCTNKSASNIFQRVFLSAISSNRYY